MPLVHYSRDVIAVNHRLAERNAGKSRTAAVAPAAAAAEGQFPHRSSNINNAFIHRGRKEEGGQASEPGEMDGFPPTAEGRLDGRLPRGGARRAAQSFYPHNHLGNTFSLRRCGDLARNFMDEPSCCLGCLPDQEQIAQEQQVLRGVPAPSPISTTSSVQNLKANRQDTDTVHLNSLLFSLALSSHN